MHCESFKGQFEVRRAYLADSYCCLFDRVFPNGEVQYLHPKDGVYPEKVNQGRQPVGKQDRSIGKNTNPVKVCPAFCYATCISDWNTLIDFQVVGALAFNYTIYIAILPVSASGDSSCQHSLGWIGYNLSACFVHPL